MQSNDQTTPEATPAPVTAVLAHPLAAPLAPGHLQFILNLLAGLVQAEAPLLLKIFPSPVVQLGILGGEIGLAAITSALAGTQPPAAA